MLSKLPEKIAVSSSSVLHRLSGFVAIVFPHYHVIQLAQRQGSPLWFQDLREDVAIMRHLRWCSLLAIAVAAAIAAGLWPRLRNNSQRLSVKL
jgi:succinate dehydrogenase/fumarate reductase cytochrome b subunit